MPRDLKEDVDSILLVLPVPLYEVGGKLYLDNQACNGLRLWLENFERVTVCNPSLELAVAPLGTLDLRDVLPTERLEVVPLPAAWTPFSFISALPSTRKRLRSMIARSRHLQFAIGGLFGDWGAIAILEAKSMGRLAAVWTDRVESDVMFFNAKSKPGIRKYYSLVTALLTRCYERYVIRRAAAGLFHGMDTFAAYSSLCQEAHLVHDVHLGSEARITKSALAVKIANIATPPLNVVYAGRVHHEKGVDDWIKTLELAKHAGVHFSATWFGDGPALSWARQCVEQRGLAGIVEFPGSITERAALMQIVRDANIFLFCHQTSESPRCLIESLVAGTVIVGYDSPYPRDLIRVHGGGILTEKSPDRLAEELVRISKNGAELARRTDRAAKDGRELTDENVFRHRSLIIKSLFGS